MQFSSNGVQIGPLTISVFSLVVIAGVLVSVAITVLRARRQGQDAAIVLDLGASMLFFGLVLGRLFYIFSPPPSAAPYYTRDWYLSHPLDLLAGPVAVWNGGLGSAGAIVGGLLGALVVLRVRRVDLWQWADILLPGALVAAVLLPWANLAQGQMLGPATDLPWGITGALPDQRYHPTPAYVSLWAIFALLFAILARGCAGKDWRPGVWCLLCGVVYCPGLFLADLLRVDAVRPLLGLSGTQLVCIVTELALVLLAWRRIKQPAGNTADVTDFTEN